MVQEGAFKKVPLCFIRIAFDVLANILNFTIQYFTKAVKSNRFYHLIFLRR
jgi:hypothetical protein